LTKLFNKLINFSLGGYRGEDLENDLGEGRNPRSPISVLPDPNNCSPDSEEKAQILLGFHRLGSEQFTSMTFLLS
jgi:hypothetical protein